MDSELARYARRSGRWGAQVVYHATLNSTNDLLLRLGEQGAAEGLLALTEFQTGGRGRLQRRWVAPAGASLLMSLLFRPPDPFPWFAARATMLCGVALVAAIREVAGVAVALKWPNDVIIERADGWGKLAGMLSEVGWQGETPFLVVGLGVNVNIPPEQLPQLAPQATSLLAESGQRVDRTALLDSFLAQVERDYAALLNGADPLPRWAAALAWLGQPVTLSTPTETLTGIAAGVDDTGALLLRLPDGAMRAFPVGDVTLRKPAPQMLA